MERTLSDQELRDLKVRLLDQAADLIEQRGWVRGRGGNFKEGFCALGALNDVSCLEYLRRTHLLAHTRRVVDDTTGSLLTVLNGVEISDLRESLAQILAEWLIAESGIGSPDDPACWVAAWNDDPSRVKSDVVNAFRKAALSVQEQA